MKLIVAGVKYPLQEAIQGATLRDLYALKIQTGLGMKSLRDSFQHMQESSPAPGEVADPLDILESEENLLALQAMVWLCKRHAGEFVSVAEANAVPLSQIGFEQEQEDPVAPDPTPARTDSGPGDELQAPAASST